MFHKSIFGLISDAAKSTTKTTIPTTRPAASVLTDIITGETRSNDPSPLDKLDMLFTDVETEGKKKGYSKAAAEYEIAFKAIEKEYADTKKLIESQKDAYDKKSEELIRKLELLEKQKESLEAKVNQKTQEVSNKYNIPIYQVQNACASGTLFDEGYSIDLLSIIYRHKEKKLREAEKRGYREAKELYESKIDNLKNKLSALKKKGNAELNQLLELIAQVLDDIAQEEMRIADLKILL